MSFRNTLACTLLGAFFIGLFSLHFYPVLHCAWLNSQLKNKQQELGQVECQWEQYCKMREGDPLRMATKYRKNLLKDEIKAIEKNINYWSRLYSRTPFYLTP